MGLATSTCASAGGRACWSHVFSAFGLALALVAWVGYSLLAPVPIDNFAYVFLVEFLAGVTVKGVFDGAKLFGWKTVVWGACYVVGLGGLVLVLLTISKAWGEIPGDFLRWLILFGPYPLVALVVWAVNARMLKKRRVPPES